MLRHTIVHTVLHWKSAGVFTLFGPYQTSFQQLTLQEPVCFDLGHILCATRNRSSLSGGDQRKADLILTYQVIQNAVIGLFERTVEIPK
jgi:hypothetical protein